VLKKLTYCLVNQSAVIFKENLSVESVSHRRNNGYVSVIGYFTLKKDT
jgi:hypothetical protein